MIRYVCQECSREVAGSAFRSTCPRCGGRLATRGRAGEDVEG